MRTRKPVTSESETARDKARRVAADLTEAVERFRRSQHKE